MDPNKQIILKQSFPRFLRIIHAVGIPKVAIDYLQLRFLHSGGPCACCMLHIKMNSRTARATHLESFQSRPATQRRELITWVMEPTIHLDIARDGWL